MVQSIRKQAKTCINVLQYNHDLLKNKMSYNGLIMIDSVRMKSLADNYLEKEILDGFFRRRRLFLDPINPIECLYIAKTQRKFDHFQSRINKVLDFKNKFKYMNSLSGLDLILVSSCYFPLWFFHLFE